MNIEALNRFIEPLVNRIMLMIGRGVLLAINDAEGRQTIKASVLAGETQENVERLNNYGFTSVPLAGAEPVIIYPSGDRSHGIAIVVEDKRYRLKGLANGEVALYDDQGTKIHLKRGNEIEITAGTGVTIDTPDTLITGNLDVTGDMSSDGAFSCNGEPPQGKVTLPPDATNNSTNRALSNAIKALLIANGQAQ